MKTKLIIELENELKEGEVLVVADREKPSVKSIHINKLVPEVRKLEKQNEELERKLEKLTNEFKEYKDKMNQKLKTYHIIMQELEKHAG